MITGFLEKLPTSYSFINAIFYIIYIYIYIYIYREREREKYIYLLYILYNMVQPVTQGFM